MKILLLVISAFLFTCSIAKADTLDFLEWKVAGVPEYWTGETELSLSNATVRTIGSNIYYAGAGGFAESNGRGTVGACTTGNCIGDMEITFSQSVSNLSFDAVGIGGGDLVTISAFNGLTNVGEFTLDGNNSGWAKLIDFSAFGDISRLFFDDLGSTRSGVAYNDFYFDSAVVSAVPLPAGFPLYAAGIGILGFMGWRRRKTQ